MLGFQKFHTGQDQQRDTQVPKKKKKAMAIDEFLLVASINTANFDLRALIESKKARKISPRKVWVPKYCLVHVDKLKREWSAVCIDPPSERNSVKGV